MRWSAVRWRTPSVQVNAYNLANRYYYDDFIRPHRLGPGRSALVGFNFKF